MQSSSEPLNTTELLVVSITVFMMYSPYPLMFEYASKPIATITATNGK